MQKLPIQCYSARKNQFLFFSFLYSPLRSYKIIGLSLRLRNCCNACFDRPLNRLTLFGCIAGVGIFYFSRSRSALCCRKYLKFEWWPVDTRGFIAIIIFGLHTCRWHMFQIKKKKSEIFVPLLNLYFFSTFRERKKWWVEVMTWRKWDISSIRSWLE